MLDFNRSLSVFNRTDQGQRWWTIDHTCLLFPPSICCDLMDHLTTPTSYFHQVFVEFLWTIWPHLPPISTKYLLCSYWPFDHTCLLFPPSICCVPIDCLFTPTFYIHQVFVMFLLTIWPHPPPISTKFSTGQTRAKVGGKSWVWSNGEIGIEQTANSNKKWVWWKWSIETQQILGGNMKWMWSNGQ